MAQRLLPRAEVLYVANHDRASEVVAVDVCVIQRHDIGPPTVILREQLAIQSLHAATQRSWIVQRVCQNLHEALLNATNAARLVTQVLEWLLQQLGNLAGRYFDARIQAEFEF